jgi:hypothetical protein
MLLGCSSDTTPINITKSVGTAGGTVSGSDGTSVVIPMGALSMSSNITLASVNAPAPAGTSLVGPAYDFGPEGTQFAQPVTITLPFDTAKIPSPRTASDIRIYTAPRGSTNYTLATTTLAGNTVSTTTTHFTVYLPAVAQVAGGNDMSMTGCTPNCTASGLTCGCTATCGSTTFAMTCSESTTAGPASCTCTINGATQSTSIVLDTCSATQAQTAFQGQCMIAA